jgi:hypothetical protein
MNFSKLIAAALFCLLATFPSARAQQSAAANNVIAKAGDLFISEEEFLRRFELTPAFGRHRKSRLEEAKLELTYSMIAEKLLAQEAAERGYSQDSTTRQAIDELSKMLARDELYRREVSGKVTISEKDLAEGIARARNDLLVAFLFFDSETDARFIRSRMRGPADFHRLQLDTTLRAVRDTATVIWGDAEPAIESAAYGLKPDQISPVVHAGNGFYILKLVSIHSNAYYAGMQPEVLRERVVSTIRLRKERERLDQFSAFFLRDKTGYAVPRTLKILARSMSAVLSSGPQDSVRSVTPEMYREVCGRCASVLHDTLAVTRSRVWTVGEVIDRLSLKVLRLPEVDTLRVAGYLNATIRQWIQQDLLAQEALRRGLANIPLVARKIEEWRQYFLAEGMKERVRRTVTVSTSEVWAYLASKDTSMHPPKVQIRELRTGTLDDMQAGIEDLQKGVPWGEVVRRWSNDAGAKRRGGFSDMFSVAERPPIGDIASQMQVGERYGPFPVNGGFLTFDLVAKGALAPGDTALASRLDVARKELLSMKQKRTISTFLAQIGQARGYTIYQDRLQQIPVSPVPMLTFRILGFGGRVLEVPFVDRQLDWLDIEPPSTKILP